MSSINEFNCAGMMWASNHRQDNKSTSYKGKPLFI